MAEETKKPVEEVKKETEATTEEVKKESQSAVEKVKETKKTKEVKAELEREYIIPIKRYILTVPRYRRAKKAIQVIREFLARHMKVEDRDLKKVKLDMHLNNEVWFRGIKKPANKIKVKAVKKDGVVYAELAEMPDVVKFAKARLEKRAEKVKAAAKKVAPAQVPKEEKVDKDKDGVDDRVEEAEDKKANAEAAVKTKKAAVKTEKHTAKGAHTKKTAPVRKSLKK